MKSLLRAVPLSLALVGILVACGDDDTTSTPADASAAADTSPTDSAPGSDAAPLDGGTDGSSDTSTTDASLPITITNQLALATVGGSSDGYRIVLSDRGPLCVAGDYATTTSLLLDITSTTKPFPTGTYTITPTSGLTVGATFHTTDAQCKVGGTSHFGRSGTIVVSSITSATVQGTYDITFDNGARLTGSFDAPKCDTSTIDAGDAGKVCRP